MPFNKNSSIEREDVLVVYLDLGDKFGFYRINPNLPPFICLNVDLLEDKQMEGVHLTVFNTLLEYHNSIPPDSPYRFFPHVRYFCELWPVSDADFDSDLDADVSKDTGSVDDLLLPAPTLTHQVMAQEPEKIIFARASRIWNLTGYGHTRLRLIG